MAKRTLTPIPAIAKRLGCHPDTVHRNIKSALRKLNVLKDAFPGEIPTIYGVADESFSIPACSSVECNREFIKLFGDASEGGAQ